MKYNSVIKISASIQWWCQLQYSMENWFADFGRIISRMQYSGNKIKRIKYIISIRGKNDICCELLPENRYEWIGLHAYAVRMCFCLAYSNKTENIFKFSTETMMAPESRPILLYIPCPWMNEKFIIVITEWPIHIHSIQIPRDYSKIYK